MNSALFIAQAAWPMYLLGGIMAACPAGLALVITGLFVGSRKSDESKKIGKIQIILGFLLFLGSLIGWTIFKKL